MYLRLFVTAIVILLFVAGCNAQPMPTAPTSIPTLAPATPPPGVTVAPSTPQTGAQAPGELPTGTAVPAIATVPAEATGEPTGEAEAEAPDAALVAAGETVFQASCFVCHELSDVQKVGPGLAGLFERDALPNGNPVTDENLDEWIHTGGGGMPPIPLNEEDTRAVIAFLRENT